MNTAKGTNTYSTVANFTLLDYSLRVFIKNLNHLMFSLYYDKFDYTLLELYKSSYKRLIYNFLSVIRLF